MSNLKFYILTVWTAALLTSCRHSRPKPVSNDITKTTVTVSGKKDSVLNNPEKNYGNASVSDICVKCLLQTVQATGSYKKAIQNKSPRKIIYDVNWITSKAPKDLGNGKQIVNGMQIDVNDKSGNKPHTVASFLYNNEDAQFYLRDKQNNYTLDSKVDSLTLIKIRNSCFWGVASAK